MRWRCLEWALLCPEPHWDCPVPECRGSGAVVATEMVPPYRAGVRASSGVRGTSLSLVPKPHCRPRAHPPASLTCPPWLLLGCPCGGMGQGVCGVGIVPRGNAGSSLHHHGWLCWDTWSLPVRLSQSSPCQFNAFDPGGRGRSPLSSHQWVQPAGYWEVRQG